MQIRQSLVQKEDTTTIFNHCGIFYTTVKNRRGIQGRGIYLDSTRFFDRREINKTNVK